MNSFIFEIIHNVFCNKLFAKALLQVMNKSTVEAHKEIQVITSLKIFVWNIKIVDNFKKAKKTEDHKALIILAYNCIINMNCYIDFSIFW